MKKTLLPITLGILSIVSICTVLFSAKEASAETYNPSTDLSDMQEYYGSVFGQGDITEVDIEIDEDDWNDLLANSVDEDYYKVNVTVNGTSIRNVGFRTKGSSSLLTIANSESEQYSFKLKFDKYLKNQTLNGLNMLVLNSNFADPTYMREYLTYSAYAYLDCITPYVSYTKLYINGEYYGLYLSIEGYDDSFVERYSDSDDTVLYKAESTDCTLLTTDDCSGFEVKYGDDDDYSNLNNLIEVLNNTTEDNKEELEAILDVDSVLKAIAINTVMGNYDSYNGSKAHNYYLLYSDGKFSYIGWDYNMSIGGYSEDEGRSLTINVLNPVLNVDIADRPLINVLLSIDEYKERYLEYIDSLTGYLSSFTNTATKLSYKIFGSVLENTNSFYTIQEYFDSLSTTSLYYQPKTSVSGSTVLYSSGVSIIKYIEQRVMNIVLSQ